MRRLLAHFALLAAAGHPATAGALDVDALWVPGRPAASEERLRAALAHASGDDALVLLTQLARTHGLRRDFDKAREILATIEPRLDRASPEVRARYFLELGRTHASAAHPASALTPAARRSARSHFLRAGEIADSAGLDALAIDALHMMPFAEPEPVRQLEWHEKALARMERSTQPRAKRWEGALRNNAGHALRLLGRHEDALAQFRLSRAAYEREGKARNVRIADWMIARTWRDQGRLREALALLHELERAGEREGEPDPHVFEELGHLYRALGEEERARGYAARAKAAAR